MKLKKALLTVWAVALLTLHAQALISVTFSGGGGSSPLSITLPAVSWEITDAASFNGSTIFGIGIAVGQTPDSTHNGDAVDGNPSDWSSSGSTTFPSAYPNSFFENSDFGGANNGGITWFGMLSNQAAVNGEIITYSGGTFSTSQVVAGTFVSGNYDLYLVSGVSGVDVSTAAVAAVPEPSTYAALFGLITLGSVLLRRRLIKVEVTK